MSVWPYGLQTWVSDKPAYSVLGPNTHYDEAQVPLIVKWDDA